MPPAQPPIEPRPFNLAAALLAWVWPGLGHIRRGERRRGMLIMFGVLLLFFAGLFIGGIDVVDRRRDRLWFLAQALCGPVVFATDFVSQNYLVRIPQNWKSDRDWMAAYESGAPEIQRQLRVTSLGRVNEIGTLYIALAGLMNLVVILDALHCTRPVSTGGGETPTE
jgi:hypothetical protein